MAKVRLVKGPFAGKVMESNSPAGVDRLLYAGTKPMTRKQKYEWQMQQWGTMFAPRPFPQVRCEYRIVMTSFEGRRIPCQHPDGSYFYEFVPGSKREF